MSGMILVKQGIDPRVADPGPSRSRPRRVGDRADAGLVLNQWGMSGMPGMNDMPGMKRNIQQRAG